MKASVWIQKHISIKSTADILAIGKSHIPFLINFLQQK